MHALRLIKKKDRQPALDTEAALVIIQMGRAPDKPERKTDQMKLTPPKPMALKKPGPNLLDTIKQELRATPSPFSGPLALLLALELDEDGYTSARLGSAPSSISSRDLARLNAAHLEHSAKMWQIERRLIEALRDAKGGRAELRLFSVGVPLFGEEQLIPAHRPGKNNVHTEKVLGFGRDFKPEDTITMLNTCLCELIEKPPTLQGMKMKRGTKKTSEKKAPVMTTVAVCVLTPPTVEGLSKSWGIKPAKDLKTARAQELLFSEHKTVDKLTNRQPKRALRKKTGGAE